MVVEAVEPVPWVSGETAGAPICTVEGPAVQIPDICTEGVPSVQLTTPAGPFQELEVEEREEASTGLPEVKATTPRAPSPVPGKKQG